MPTRYKLRLGDGTVLVVDREGLSTWLVDNDAKVQGGNARDWYPLRKFLLMLRAAEGRAERTRPAPPAELPLVPPPPRDTPLPTTPPPDESSSPPPEPPAPPEPAPPPEPILPPAASAPVETPAVPAIAAEPAWPADDEIFAPVLPPAPAETPDLAGGPPDFERLTSPDVPPAPALSEPPAPYEPPVAEAPPAAPETPSPAPWSEPSPPPWSDAELGGSFDEPAVYRSDDGETGRVESPPIGQPAGVQALADEPASFGPEVSRPAAEELMPTIPLKPLEDEPPSASPSAPWSEPSLPPEEEIERPRRPPRASPSAPVPLGPRPSDQRREHVAGLLRGHEVGRTILSAVSALGTFVNRHLERLAITPSEWEPPPDEADSAAVLPEAGVARPSPPRPAPSRPTPRPAAREVAAPPSAVAPPVQVLADEPARPEAAGRTPVDSLPVIPLKPLEEEGAPGDALAEKLRAATAVGAEWVRGWSEKLGERLRGLRLPRAGGGSGPAPSPEEPSPMPGGTPWPNPARERTTARSAEPPAPPPTHISDLPALRLAPVREREEKEDVFDGELETYEAGPGVLSVVWAWTRVLVVVGAIAAGGTYAALHWRTLIPKARELAQTVVTEIDRQARSGQRSRQLEQDLQRAAEALPHLSADTVKLVLSTSPGGSLAPAEVFRVARDAADRGRSRLDPAEARELAALEEDLLAALGPRQRTRLREYDRARARSLALPFEDPSALVLYVEGARSLPPQRLERLRTLLATAVAAGIE